MIKACWPLRLGMWTHGLRHLGVFGCPGWARVTGCRPIPPCGWHGLRDVGVSGPVETASCGTLWQAHELRTIDRGAYMQRDVAAALTLPAVGVLRLASLGNPRYRSGRKPLRSSSAKTAGCSQAAKCPPFSSRW